MKAIEILKTPTPLGRLEGMYGLIYKVNQLFHHSSYIEDYENSVTMLSLGCKQVTLACESHGDHTPMAPATMVLMVDIDHGLEQMNCTQGGHFVQTILKGQAFLKPQHNF